MGCNVVLAAHYRELSRLADLDRVINSQDAESRKSEVSWANGKRERKELSTTECSLRIAPWPRDGRGGKACPLLSMASVLCPRKRSVREAAKLTDRTVERMERTRSSYEPSSILALLAPSGVGRGKLVAFSISGLRSPCAQLLGLTPCEFTPSWNVVCH